MRVLLVEDDSDLGSGLQVALKPEGYTVDWLTDGLQALQALETDCFDLVILDLGLPRLDGLSILRQVRAQGKNTPILILTARDAVQDRIDGLDSGADDYLIKPFEMTELKARIRALLRRSSGRAQPIIKYRGIELDPSSQKFMKCSANQDMSSLEIHSNKCYMAGMARSKVTQWKFIFIICARSYSLSLFVP